MSFNATFLLPRPSLYHPPRHHHRPQRQPFKLALFRLDRGRRADVIDENPPSLEPLQFPKEPIIDLTTCFSDWEKQENSTLKSNDAENDDNTANITRIAISHQFLQLPQSDTPTLTTQKPSNNRFQRKKSSCTFTNPVEQLSLPPTQADTSLLSPAMPSIYPNVPLKSQSDCGHGYTQPPPPLTRQKLQKSSRLLRGFSFSARSRQDIYSNDTQHAEMSFSQSSSYNHDVPVISHSRSYLSSSPAPPSSWSRVGSAVSLDVSSSAEPSPAPSRNTSSSSLSRWMFWRGSAGSWKGKAREDERESEDDEDKTTWETPAVKLINSSEEVKRSKVAQLTPPPPTPPATDYPLSDGRNNQTSHDKSTIPRVNTALSEHASTSNLEVLPNEIDLSHDSHRPKNTSRRHKADGSISSVHTLARALGHDRNTSWGDAAAVLLFGTAAEAIADRERERADLLGLLGEQVFGGSATGMESRDGEAVEKTLLKFTPSQRRRARFVLGGGDSELDIPVVQGMVAKSEKPSAPRPRLLRRDAYVDAESEPEDIENPVTVPEATGRDAILMQRYRSVAEAIVDESLLDEELMRVVERLRKERLARPRPFARSSSATNSGSSTSPSDGTRSTPMSTPGVPSPEDEWEAIDDLRREIWEGVPIDGIPDYEDSLNGPVGWGLSLQGGQYAPLRDSPHQEFSNEVDTAFNFKTSEKGKARPGLPSQPNYPSPVTLSPSSSSSSAPLISPNPSPTYQTALRALLITREILLTETNYLNALTQLLTSKTRTPPPALMLHYASDLLQVSKKLAEEMRSDVSVKGIARAFLKCEIEVERAFARWCGVVGGWFVEGREFEEPPSIAEGQSMAGHGVSGMERRRNTRVSLRQASLVEGEVLEYTTRTAEPVSANAVEDILSTGNSSPLKRTVSTWRRSLPSMVGMNQESTPGMYGAAWRKSERERCEAEEEEERKREKERKKRPAVRDLAILPTQRVMRYVLLYRDLLSCTPRNSSSRVYVERALEAACRIAGRCDRAQGNAAFVASSSSSACTSRSNSNGSSSSAATSVTSVSNRSSNSPSPVKSKMGRFGSKRASLMVSPISVSLSASSGPARSVSGISLDKKNRASHPPLLHAPYVQHNPSVAPRAEPGLIPSDTSLVGKR